MSFGAGICGMLSAIIEYECAVQRGDGAMDLRPGAENRQKREWLRRDSRSASAKAGALTPFRQFFATSSVTCPYIVGRAERKLIVELGGAVR